MGWSSTTERYVDLAEAPCAKLGRWRPLPCPLDSRIQAAHRRCPGRGPGGSSRLRAVTASGSSPTLSTTRSPGGTDPTCGSTLTGQTRLCWPDRDWEIEGEITEDYQRVKLSRLRPGEQFVYAFDLGDDWAHLCTVGAQRIDPVEALGIRPGKPLSY